MTPVYFDNNATTPLDPRVRDAMRPWLEEQWGNASSAHRYGQAAFGALETARSEVAGLLGGSPDEIVFTASGTEANNAVVAGALRQQGGGNLVVSGFEHPSILAALDAWAPAAGVEVVKVAPGRDGVVAVETLAAALRSDTRLVALMLANNELGTVQPVAEVARRARQLGVPVLCDAVQAAAKLPISVAELGVDYLTVGAHKFHGPLGAAALWVRAGVPFDSFLVGGSQERRRRASTANVPALVGFGCACALAGQELPARVVRLRQLRERLERGLAEIPGAVVHGAGVARLPHTTNVSFPGVVNQELMMRLDLAGFAVSTGAACGSGTVQPSPSLAAMGVSRELSTSAVRISFGTQNRIDEVERFLPVLAESVAALRRSVPERSAASARR